MGKKWLLRLIQTIVGIWGLASAVFLISHLGSVEATDLAIPDATDMSGSSVQISPAARQFSRQATQHRLGLDLPLFYWSRNAHPTTQTNAWQWNGSQNQYHIWAGHLMRGNLGVSLRTGQRVTSELALAMTYTLPLIGIALAIMLPLSLWLAQHLAAYPWWGQAARILLVNLQALPLFVVALVLLLTVANPEVFDWFPAYGLNQQPAAEVGCWAWLGSYLYHAVLPVFSLVISALPAITIQLEASLATELASPYIVTARAKGLTTQQVIRGHALRNAILPLLTQLTEVLPSLVAGAVVVEMVFAVPGMGRLLAHAATTRDYPLLIGGVLLIGTARLLALLLADFLYTLADPRI